MQLSLYGGERALLVTPASCGSYAAQSTLTPWSGTPAVTQTSNLEIDSGPGGGACPSGRFSPSFTAGTLNNQAGASSAFTLTLSRQDGEQRFGAFTVKLPAGLSGILSGVVPCPEPQASIGACPPSSQIGTATVGVGPGADPFYLPEQGRQASGIYLTGPYHGRSISGSSIVVPAIAGPFDLGTVVVRAQVVVDPRTAQLTIASDPLPAILEGIPLDIRTLALTIDRPGFIFNPTTCAPRRSPPRSPRSSGTDASVSSPFQAANCASLPFRPRLDGAHARARRAERTAPTCT